MRLKLSNEAKIEPPIQVEYSRSWGAEILIFVSLGEGRRSSDKSRSPNPKIVYHQRYKELLVTAIFVSASNPTLQNKSFLHIIDDNKQFCEKHFF
jgi:hypothetical protein